MREKDKAALGGGVSLSFSSTSNNEQAQSTRYKRTSTSTSTRTPTEYQTSNQATGIKKRDIVTMDKDSLRSPIIPQTPAPAYTPLPNSHSQASGTYHSAPLLNGRMGDIELETVDGKMFLVHKSVLEAETVFFHI